MADIGSQREEICLSLQSVSKHYGQVKAVDCVNLDVTQREFFSLLGPSGSGKTTLLRIIAGLEQPGDGRVIAGAQDVTSLPPYRRRIGMVFQNFLLFPHKTVSENIIFPLRMQRASRTECDEGLKWALDLLRLGGLGDRYPNELSGGQQQRVSLARGLISRPTLLLLDEPLANLDRELRAEMEVEIRRYQRELNIPFVYVTHNQEEALTMSDRIAIMRNGVFEQVGAREEVYTKPETAFVASFIGESNHFDGKAIDTGATDMKIEWHGKTFIAPRQSDISPGDSVRFSVKCEDVDIVAGGRAKNAPEFNQVTGRLRDIIFKGQTANYIVETQDKSEIVASQGPRGVDVKIGDDVVAQWSTSAGMGFKI